MKSFKEYREFRKNDTLLWESARVFVENDINPVIFTWNFFEGQLYELLECSDLDSDTHKAILQILSEKEEILGDLYLEATVGDDYNAGKGWSLRRGLGRLFGRGARKAVGAGAGLLGYGRKKLGDALGGIANFFRPFGKELAQGWDGGAEGAPTDPSAATPPGSPQTPPDQTPGNAGANAGGGDDPIKAVVGFLTQAMQAMKAAQFHNSYGAALQKMMDSIAAGKHGEDFGGSAALAAAASAEKFKGKIEELKQMVAANDPKLQGDIAKLSAKLEKNGVDLVKLGLKKETPKSQQTPLAIDPAAVNIPVNAHTEYEGEDFFEQFTGWLDGYEKVFGK